MRSALSDLAAMAFAALCTTACGGDEIDEAGAAQLWDRLQTEAYRTWDRAPGWESRQPTVSVHGQTADIFVNTVASDALQTQNLTEWPAGALFVKDGYRNDTLALIAAMEKRSSEWFFAEWDGEGRVKFAGSPSVCLDCHGAAPDFVFSAVLP